MKSTVIPGQNTKCLIIGSNGFIGSHLTSTLSKRMRCTGARTTEYTYSSNDFGDANIHSLESDRSISSVVFCGGAGGFGLSAKSASLQGSQYEHFVRECSKVSSIKELYLLSSLGAAASRMSSSYKELCMCKEQATTSLIGAKGVSIRLPSIYGYDPISGIHKGLPGAIAYGLAKNKTISIYGGLNTTRNYISIQTTSEALSSIITSSRRSAAGRRLISLANKYNMSTHQILKIVCKSLRRTPRIQLVDTRALDVESHDPSIVDGFIDYIYSDLSHWSRTIYGRV